REFRMLTHSTIQYGDSWAKADLLREIGEESSETALLSRVATASAKHVDECKHAGTRNIWARTDTTANFLTDIVRRFRGRAGETLTLDWQRQRGRSCLPRTSASAFHGIVQRVAIGDIYQWSS